jgi:hypothetical protein
MFLGKTENDMDFGQLIYSMPMWALFVLTVAVFMIAVQIGAWLARIKRRGEEQDSDGPLGTLVGAILGLLAFILAFTFSMTMSRLDARKKLVLEESNAVGTTYLRAGLLPDRQGAEIRRLLREYVDVRLEATTALSKVKEGVIRSEEIHRLLWLQAQSLVNENMDSEIRSLFIESLNEVIDLHESRKTVALLYRIPGTMWLLLYLLSVLSMLTIGYQIGSVGARRQWSVPVLTAAFALVIAMIADIDRPNGNWFRLSQQPIVDVQEMMREDSKLE